jgi:uncharacterized membrane protein
MKKKPNRLPDLANEKLPQIEPVAEISVEGSMQMTRIAPLPDPSELSAYGEIDPLYPERIFRMAEKVLELKEYEIKRQRDNEEFEIKTTKIIIDGFNKSNLTKIWLDFIIILIGFVAAFVFAILFKNDYLAVASIVAPILIFLGKIISSFVGTKGKKE